MQYNKGAVAESSVVVSLEVVPLVMANSASEMVPSVVTVEAKNDVVSSKKGINLFGFGCNSEREKQDSSIFINNPVQTYVQEPIHDGHIPLEVLSDPVEVDSSDGQSIASSNASSLNSLDST